MTQTELLVTLVHVIVFLLGAGIGSFLNVVIYRLPLGMSVNNPRRSFCPHCKKQIPWYRNLPLITWLLQRGKCAECAARIPFRYFFVELLTACLFYAVFLKFHTGWENPADWGGLVLVFWIFTALLIAGTFIDIDHYILPHEITLGGLGVGLVASFFVPEMMGETTGTRGLLLSFVSACIGLGILWLVVELGKLAFGRIKHDYEKPEDWSITQPDEKEPPVFRAAGEELTWADIFTRQSDRLIIHGPALTVNDRQFTQARAEIHMSSMKVHPVGGPVAAFQLEDVTKLEGRALQIVIPREAMGFGDVLLLAMIGAFLGWQSVLFTLIAASVLGCLCAVIPRLFGNTEWARKIPFGPYLAGGAMIWLFYGPQIVDWYLSRMRLSPSEF